MEQKYFTGIGSRSTPKDICEIMSIIPIFLNKDHGYILRSGGAPGADLAFETFLSNDVKNIYLPWKGFNDNKSQLYNVTTGAYSIAEKFHPAWKSLSQAGKKLHARNVYQVLGEDLNTPSDFVLCWTADFCESHETRSRETGGTGTAISIASYFNVPVFNMARKDWYKRFEKMFPHFKNLELKTYL